MESINKNVKFIKIHWDRIQNKNKNVLKTFL